ncbi:MAG TPA: hypothetical protein GXX73_09315 [Clostridium sp.]|nr:hypothetical protein [Clostridium sp.]
MIYKNRLLKTIRYNVKATTISPLSIRDSEDNLKIDELTDKVYIPGSSVAGAFRNYYESYIDKNSNEDFNELFGGKKTGLSQVAFYDSYLINHYVEEMISSRPGIKMDPKRLTVEVSDDIKKSGKKFKRQFLNEGLRFEFIFELNNYEDGAEKFEDKERKFEDLLRAFSIGDISLGSNKMVGYGRFKVDSISKSVFDFTNINDLLKFMLRETESNEITHDILDVEHKTSKVRFKIKGKTVTPVLVKDEVIRLSNEPDGINIKDSKGNYIIPGSSLKGIIRSRAERLQKTFPCIDKKIITNIFGIESKDDDGQISRLSCFDSIIKKPMKNTYNKIKIDYYTGGIMQGALTDNEVVMGDLEIECTFNTSRLSDYQREVGLLLLVLRDLCKEDLSIGSGYAVGRGYIKADTLELFDGEKLVFDFKSPDIEVLKKFDLYISNLMNVR